MNIALGWQKIEDDVRLVLDNSVEKSVVHTVGVLSWAKNASVRVELQRSVVFAAKTAFQFHHRLISLTNANFTDSQQIVYWILATSKGWLKQTYIRDDTRCYS